MLASMDGGQRRAARRRGSIVQDVRELAAQQSQDDSSDVVPSIEHGGFTASSLSRSAITAFSSPSMSLDDDGLRNTTLLRNAGACSVAPEVLFAVNGLSRSHGPELDALTAFGPDSVTPAPHTPARPRRLDRLYVRPLGAATQSSVPPCGLNALPASGLLDERAGCAYVTGFGAAGPVSTNGECVTTIDIGVGSFTLPRLGGDRGLHHEAGVTEGDTHEGNPLEEPTPHPSSLQPCGDDRRTSAAAAAAMHTAAAADEFAALATPTISPRSPVAAGPSATCATLSHAPALHLNSTGSPPAAAATQQPVTPLEQPETQRAGRARVRLKLHSVHPEQLQPGTLAALGRLLLPRGWLLTGAAVRRGCIELVLDYSRVECVDPEAIPGELLPADADYAAETNGVEGRAAGAAAGIGRGGAGRGTGVPGAGAGWMAPMFPESRVAELVSCLHGQGVLDPALEPGVSVQVDRRLNAVRWQWAEEWAPPVPAAGEGNAVDTAAAPSWPVWGAGAGAEVSPPSVGVWRCTAVAVGYVSPVGAAPLVEPACVVARCGGCDAVAAGGSDRGTVFGANGADVVSNGDAAGGHAEGDAVELRVQVPCGDVHSCTVRCLGRFLPTRELSRRPLRGAGGVRPAAAGAVSVTAVEAGPGGTVRCCQGSHHGRPAAESTGPHSGHVLPRSEEGVQPAAVPRAATTIGTAAACGDALVIAVEQLPQHSALLQVEVRVPAATGPACEPLAAGASGREGGRGAQAGQRLSSTEDAASWWSSNALSDPVSDYTVDSALLPLPSGGPWREVSEPREQQGQQEQHQERQQEQEQAEPCLPHGSVCAEDLLLAAAPVLLLRACSCRRWSYAGGNGTAAGIYRHDRTEIPAEGSGRAEECSCCAGAWPSDVAMGAARELCGLRERIAAQAAGVAGAAGSPAYTMGFTPGAGDAAGSEPAARAAETEGATSELLFDLGLLLDAASCASADREEAAAPGGSGALVHGSGSGGSQVPGCEQVDVRVGAEWSVTQEVRGWLYEQLIDGVCGGGGSTSGGDGGSATGTESPQTAVRCHLTDVAVTLLAGCAELSLPFTTQLVEELAVLRLRLSEREALLLAAADGDANLEARLRAFLQATPAAPPPAPEAPAAQAAPAAPGQTPPSTGKRNTSTTVAVMASEFEVPVAGAPVTRSSCSSLPGSDAGYACPAPTAAPAHARYCGILRGELWGRPRPAAAVAWDLGRQVVACFTGFSSPTMEQAFWRDTARRMQPTCRLFAVLTLAFMSLSVARALIEDGPAAAAFMLLYQGGQAALLAAFGLWGDGAPGRLFAAVAAASALRCVCHVLLAAGLVPLPSFVLPVCRAWGDLINEGGAKATVEQVPVWLFAVLMVFSELPTAYMLYDHMNGHGRGLLTSSVPLRLAAFATLKTTITLGSQAVRRLRFLARSAAAKVE